MRKAFSPVAVVGVALTLACCAFYIARVGLIETISAKVYDRFLCHTAIPPQSGRVAVVDLDDPSLEAVGQWPWPRYVVADLTRRILADEPSVVAFDVVFPERDRTAPASIRTDLKRHLGLEVTLQGLPEELADYDAVLARTIQTGRVILGCAMSPSDSMLAEADASIDPFYDGSHLFARSQHGGNVNVFLQQAGSVLVSIPSLRKASLTAFFNAQPDADNIVRSNPLVWSYGPDRIYPSLALEAIRIDRGISQCLVQFDERGVLAVRLRDLAIPCTRNGCLVVNYRTIDSSVTSGFVSSFPRYPAADVLAGRVPSGAFKGKIVFVGTSAVGLRDIKATPLTELFSGVEVHATMVDNILAGDMLSRPNDVDGMELVGMLLAGLLLTFLITRGRAWWSFVFTVAAVVCTVALSFALLKWSHLVVMPTWAVFSILVIYLVLTTVRYWQEEVQRKRVRNMFGTMVSAEVLRYLEHNPQSFSLTGVKAEATIFFSDVAGFTTLSERLAPERLSELLNRYLTPMTNIIMARSGYVDKYEGDCIMAEWGVPFPMQDHAVQACIAALEQQEKLAEIRPQLLAEFGHDVQVRMGLNSGTVTAGNMGSQRRFSYTVMGDVVNFASRCEPANKQYGTSIMIGESTFLLARAAIEARLLDRIVAKGKTVPIQVYELLGLKGRITQDQTTVLCLYEEALHLHWRRQWDDAIARLDEALKVVPNDGPSRQLHARIELYRLAPPGESWTGEFVHTSKG